MEGLEQCVSDRLPRTKWGGGELESWRLDLSIFDMAWPIT